MSEKQPDPFLATGFQPNHRPSLSVLVQNSSDTSIGDASMELPSAPPLDHALFAGKDFEASEFLLQRRHTALDELRSELRAYLATLRTSLVAVINEEYEAFIGLSLGLRHANVATSLSTIRRPVFSIRTEVSRVKDELEAMREEMETVLGERKEVREAKALLRRLLEMEEGVEKVEGLLKLGEGGVVKRDAEDQISVGDSPAKRLERIAGEYNQMLYLVAKAGDLPFVRSLDPRIARITSTLHLDLSQLLTSVIASASTAGAKSTRESLTSLFRTYASLGLHAAAEDIARRTLVRPFVLKTIHRDVLSGPQSPVIPQTPLTAIPFETTLSESSGLAPAINVIDRDDRAVPPFYVLDPIGVAQAGDGKWEAGRALGEQDDPPLVTLYNKILSFISRDCGVILDVAERTLAVPPPTTLALAVAGDEKKKRGGYELLTDVLWDEIANRLMSELGTTIYAAGRPAVFHQNYTITSTFISRIESLAPTLTQLTALRAHSSYVNFVKRFQLPVYFQLRFKEIVMTVERALDGAASTTGGQTFLLLESEVIWSALQKCWSDEVYLPELAARFWRLTLQLISRYRTWLNAIVPRYVMPPQTPATSVNLSALTAAQPTSARNSFDMNRPPTSLSAASTRPGTPGTPGGGDDPPPSEEATLRQLTVLIADSSLMGRKVFELYEERIHSRLLGEDDVQEGSPAAVLRESLALVSSLGPALSSQIVTILCKRCAEHLKHVKPVMSQVRASTRKGPSEPSFFVYNIFKELRSYVAGPAKVVDEESRTKWASAVVEDVMARYSVILTTTKKTQAGLRWLKKGRQGLSFFGRGAAPAEDGSVEEDKVKLQMQLDIDTLVKEALTIGVDVTGSPAYDALRRSIEEGEGEGAEGEKK